MGQKEWKTHNPGGSKRVVVTKEIPGTRWLETLIRAGCRVEVCTSTDVLSVAEVRASKSSSPQSSVSCPMTPSHFSPMAAFISSKVRILSDVQISTRQSAWAKIRIHRSPGSFFVTMTRLRPEGFSIIHSRSVTINDSIGISSVDQRWFSRQYRFSLKSTLLKSSMQRHGQK